MNARSRIFQLRSIKEKSAWDRGYCQADLIRLDFAYHARRSSDPVQLFNTVLSDLLQAFDKLDLEECLPAIFREANDLLSLLIPLTLTRSLNNWS